MNLNPARPRTPTFHGGEFVTEGDSGLRGRIVAPGPYPGEWRIQCVDGGETICLAENLVLAPEPAPTRTRAAHGADRPDPPRRG